MRRWRSRARERRDGLSLGEVLALGLWEWDLRQMLEKDSRSLGRGRLCGLSLARPCHW